MKLASLMTRERIPYKPKTIRNLMCQGIFIEGVHFTRLTGRPIFLWSRIQQLLKEGRHERAGTSRAQDQPSLPRSPYRRTEKEGHLSSSRYAAEPPDPRG